MTTTQQQIDRDSPEHVILFAFLRWFSRHEGTAYPLPPDVVILSALHEQEGPLGAYGLNGVRTRVGTLRDRGYIARISVYGRGIGWTLTDQGLAALERLGRPAQYDH